MRSFKFRLERLLDIRKYHEREWELKLAAIIGVCISLVRGIEERKQKMALTATQPTDTSNSFDTGWQQSFAIYRQRLRAEITNLGKELKVKEQEREKVKRQYLEVSKKRKILEKLRERKAREYYKEQLKEEHKITDNINIVIRRR